MLKGVYGSERSLKFISKVAVRFDARSFRKLVLDSPHCKASFLWPVVRYKVSTGVEKKGSETYTKAEAERSSF